MAKTILFIAAVNLVALLYLNKFSFKRKYVRYLLSASLVGCFVAMCGLVTQSGKDVVTVNDSWITSYHVQDASKDIWVFSSEDKDIIIAEQRSISVYEDLERVFIPTLGLLKIKEQTDDFIYTEGAVSAYSGLSGTRVLSADLQKDIGFVLGLEENSIKIVKTWNIFH